MANAVKLRETVAVIRKNQHRWDQDDWAQGEVNPTAKDWQECGTSFCFFGWRCVLDGLRPIHVVDYDEDDNEVVVATGGFYDPRVDDDADDYISASTHGRKSFELTEHEAWVLSRFFTTDIDAFEARVEAVIAGTLNSGEVPV